MNASRLAVEFASRFGRTFTCSVLPDSSGGTAFKVVGPAHPPWVAKATRSDKGNTALVAVAAMAAAARRLESPKLVLSDPVDIDGWSVYVYEYVQGASGWNHIYDFDFWREAGHLASKLTTALTTGWRSGEFGHAVPATFALDERLDAGIQFLSRDLPRLARAVESRLSGTDRVSDYDLCVVHTDLHPGNIVVAKDVLVPVDFDSVAIAPKYKAITSLLGKVYEFAGRRRTAHACCAAVMRGYDSYTRVDYADWLGALLVEKKLGELQYLEVIAPRRTAAARLLTQYRAASLRGLRNILADWASIGRWES